MMRIPPNDNESVALSEAPKALGPAKPQRNQALPVIELDIDESLPCHARNLINTHGVIAFLAVDEDLVPRHRLEATKLRVNLHRLVFGQPMPAEGALGLDS